MLANQLQLWKFLDPSTNFDSITEFAVLEVALEIPKRADSITFYPDSLFMFFNSKFGTNVPQTCIQRSVKHWRDFVKWMSGENFPETSKKWSVCIKAISTQLVRSLRVEIGRYLKILHTDFCITSHNQKTFKVPKSTIAKCRVLLEELCGWRLKCKVFK